MYVLKTEKAQEGNTFFMSIQSNTPQQAELEFGKKLVGKT